MAYFALEEAEASHEIVVATGGGSGTYFALGTALARVLEAEGVVRTAEVLSTDGSVANMRLIGDAGSGVDLAFVQSDTPPSTSARLITPLYKEVLHILVARDIADQVETIYDFSGFAWLSAPPVRVPGNWLKVCSAFRRDGGRATGAVAGAAAEGLVDGSVDAAFILTAILPFASGRWRRSTRFASSVWDSQEVGNESDGLALAFHAITATTIPRSTYVASRNNP